MRSNTIRDLRECIGALSKEVEQGNLAFVRRHGQPLFISVSFDENHRNRNIDL